MKIFRLFLTTLALATASPSLAWDGIVTGTIQYFTSQTNSPTGYAGVGILGYAGTLYCGPTGSSQAFLQITEPNYQGSLAVLLTAYGAQRPVTLYLTNQSGYCEIQLITAN